MADAKMSPRQKMINLMYLVFIAMLAMNMDKEVLSAFGYANEELENNNNSAHQKNKAVYENLANKAADQAAKFGSLNQKAIKIKKISREYYNYLADLKSKMTSDLEDKKAYESMDKPDFLDEYFFTGDKYTKGGEEYVAKMNNFRTELVSILGDGYEDLVAVIQKRFSTQPVTNTEGAQINWLDYHFKGFPLVASLNYMNLIQTNIVNTESDIITSMLGGKMEESLSLSNYKGIVALDKNAYFVGEKVTGKVVLGRYDATMVPDKVTLNDKPYDNIKDGQVILDMSAGNVGNHDIKGAITFTQNGQPVEVPFESSYSVITRPNSAVISADKMNVVYRGLQNPVSVSLPGVADKDVKVSFSGASSRKVGAGKYMISPGGGKIVNVNVSATLSDGKPISSKKSFRIKDIPPAVMMVNGKSGRIRLPRSAFANASFRAGLSDFMFDLKINTIGFDVKVPGQFPISVSGSRINAKVKKALSKAKRGDVITIFNVRASVSGSSYKLKKVLGASIELIN